MSTHRVAIGLAPVELCPVCGQPARLDRLGDRWVMLGCAHVRPDPEREASDDPRLYAVFEG